MARSPRHSQHECSVTDASGVVHRAAVKRYIVDGRVVSIMLFTGCLMRASSWSQARAQCRDADLPVGWNLPKILHGDNLMVKYEPLSLLAPGFTCIPCMAWVGP